MIVRIKSDLNFWGYTPQLNGERRLCRKVLLGWAMCPYEMCHGVVCICSQSWELAVWWICEELFIFLFLLRTRFIASTVYLSITCDKLRISNSIKSTDSRYRTWASQVLAWCRGGSFGLSELYGIWCSGSKGAFNKQYHKMARCSFRGGYISWSRYLDPSSLTSWWILNALEQYWLIICTVCGVPFLGNFWTYDLFSGRGFWLCFKIVGVLQDHELRGLKRKSKICIPKYSFPFRGYRCFLNEPTPFRILSQGKTRSSDLSDKML